MATYGTTPRPYSDNWHPGRQGHAVDQYVCHVTEGSRSSVRSHFNDPGSDASVHWMVCTDGSRDQFVAESDTAFGAGIVDRPAAPLVLARPGVNPNLYSIHVEHEGTGTEPLTPPQLESSAELLHDIRARWPLILPDRTHCVRHHEIRAGKTCPGRIDLEQLLRVSQGFDATVPAREEWPPVVWSPSLGWLVVLEVVSDTEWYFAPIARVRTTLGRDGATRAGTALSLMPLEPR